MQAPNPDIKVVTGTTLQGVELHILDDIELLRDILNNCDRYTQLDGIFLCVRGELTGLFTYDPNARDMLATAS